MQKACQHPSLMRPVKKMPLAVPTTYSLTKCLPLRAFVLRSWFQPARLATVVAAELANVGTKAEFATPGKGFVHSFCACVESTYPDSAAQA